MSVAAGVVRRWQVPELELAPPVSSVADAVEVEDIEPAQAPPLPTLDEIQAIRDQAQAEGRAEGFLDGQAQGFAQGEAQMRRLIAQMEGILDNFTRPLARLESEVATALGELAVRIAGTLTGRALASDPVLLADLVAAALDAAGGMERGVDVRLHPDDIAVLDGRIAASVHLVADGSLRRGDVRVHAQTVRIDGSLSARLDAALAEVIAQAGALS